MKIEINGANLEFDVFDADKAELFQVETNKMIEMSKKLKSADSNDLAKIIRTQCKAVFDFIDTLFGDNKHREIFGESVNLRECLDAYDKINKAILEDKNNFISGQKNRAARRSAKKKNA